MIKIAIAVTVAVIPAVVIALQFGDTRNALDRSLEGNGFYPLKPPSTLVGPGSIYHVSRDGKFYRTICKAEDSKVMPFVMRSPSEEMMVRELQKAKYSLGADAMRMINAHLESDTIESANYTLSSVSVLEIPLDRNEEILIELTGHEACRKAIDDLLANREFVCQGQSALLATVEYRLVSKANVGGRVELTPEKLTPEKASSIKAALQETVNANIDFANGKFTSGTGLYYGVKVNPYCISRPTDRVARCRATASTVLSTSSSSTSWAGERGRAGRSEKANRRRVSHAAAIADQKISAISDDGDGARAAARHAPARGPCPRPPRRR